MVIVIVIDTFEQSKSAASIAAQNILRVLTAAGHEVRVVACGGNDAAYGVRKRWIPYFTFMGRLQGITYARPDEEVLRKAFDGADIVHLMLPFALEKRAEAIARRMELPAAASFAMDGYDFVKLAGFGLFPHLAPAVCRHLQSVFYFKFKNTLCHSRAVYDALPRYAFDQKLHLIENSEFDNPAAAAAKLEKLYARVIEDDRALYADTSREIFKRNWAIMPSSIDVTNPYKKKNLFFRCWYSWCYFWTVTLAAAVTCIGFGLRAEGRENLSGIQGGAITVSNHVHNIDGAFIAVSLIPNKITFTSIEGNFRLPVVRWLTKWVGVVPIPAGTHLMGDFFKLTVEQLKKGKKVHFYPEASLWKYADILRPFKKGAFHMAADAGVPVIPVTLVQRPCTGLRRIFRKKPIFTAVILPAVYADPSLSGAYKIEDLKNRTYNAMLAVLEKNRRAEKFPPQI